MSYQDVCKYLRPNLWPVLACAAALHAQTPAGCPGAATGTFTGCYYNNATLSGTPALIRTDSQINFNWGAATPGKSITSGKFSAVWQGNFAFAQGSYTFTVTASDGIRLYLDGRLVMDHWQDQKQVTFSATQALSKGNHLIAVEYYEQTGAAMARISWQNNLPATQQPVITSFTATPSAVKPGQPVTLSWNVSGATTLTIDNSIGDVRRETSVTVWPTQNTTYTLTASKPGATSKAAAMVSVSPGGNQQPPAPPKLVGAKAVSGNEVDLSWSASPTSQGLTGYQVSRNGAVAGSVPASTLSWSDKTVKPESNYTYTLKAYDAADLYSAASNAIQVTTPAPTQPPGGCPAPDTGAFTGCYFDNATLSGVPTFVRHDGQVYFYWGISSPDSSLQPSNFSARWQGHFHFTGGNYTFTAIASDGLRVYVDGTAIIDEWQDRAPTTWTVSHTIPQGSHLIVVEYYERTGHAIAQLSWQSSAPTPNAPVISAFTATPSSIPPGQPVTLHWTVTGASTISIDNVGVVTGSSFTVWPTQTTTYTLTASGAGGNSTASATVTINASPDTQPPSAPKLVSATAPNSSAVNLAWTASTDNLGVYGYQVLRNGYGIATVPASALAWSDTSVTAGSMYMYAVKAFDAAGNYSASSNNAQVTVPLVLSSPVISSFTATPATTAAGNAVTLAWTVSGATKLTINNNVGDVTNGSSASSSPAVTTTYILSASNGSGTSTASVTVTITQATDKQPPSVPTLVSATVNSSHEVDLVWNASTDNVGVAGYQIIRNGAVVATASGAVTTYNDSSVAASASYSYSVKAFDSAGNYSAASNAIQVATPTPGNSNISVTWYGACWFSGTVNGVTGNFQTVDFALTTSSPVPLQGTLFFAPNCSASNGVDNLNDYGTTITSTHMIQGFSHHPNVMPTSAYYWFGPLTADGTCAPGAPCSGCVNYTSTTPSCDALP